MKHTFPTAFVARSQGRRVVPARRQAGLTLIELMISIVIGMIMIAALATLIGSQSSSRAEIDKSGRMIENGRYGLQALATDLQLAGYWGELNDQPAAPAALPNPCSTTAADIQAAMGIAVQGYDAPAALPAALAACVGNHKAGTDVLVVRRADPDTSATEDGAANVDLSKLVAGQLYVQAGLDPTGVILTTVLAAASTNPATNASTFALKKKDKVSIARLRKVVVDIYYVSTCSVCATNDGGSPIPTLKRVELGASGGGASFVTTTLAEGIENLQFDYGRDTDGDGTPNGADLNGSTFGVGDWANVTTVQAHLLARSAEPTGGFEDTKSYALGTAGSITPSTAEKVYKRHAFVQSVRLVNPSGRRQL